MYTVAQQPPAPRPLVSVSVLTYNAVDYVVEALDSVLAQVVDFPVEIVVGDDASGDGTRELLRDYAARYPAVIRLHLHERHGAGVPGRVNNMHNLNSCRGEFIALLDGDDFWITTDKLARQVAFLRAHPGHTAVGCDGVVLEAGERRPALAPELRGADVDLGTLARCGITGVVPAGYVFRRDALLPLPPWFDEVLLADHYMVSLLMQAGPCRLLPERHFCYRRHATTFSATYLRDASRTFAAYDDLERHRRTFPALADSWLLDWRQLVTLTRLAGASVTAVRPNVLREVARRLMRRRVRSWLRAGGRGVSGYLRRRFARASSSPPPSPQPALRQEPA